MRFTVTYEDGTSVEASPAPADVLAFEDKHGMSLVAAMNTGSSRWTLYLSWAWLTRRTGEGRSFEDWLDTVASVTSAKAPDPEGPTSAGSEPEASPAP